MESKTFYRLTIEDAECIMFPNNMDEPLTNEEQERLNKFFNYLVQKFSIYDWQEYVSSSLDLFNQEDSKKVEDLV